MKKKTDYIQYPEDTRVFIPSIGMYGEAYESAFGVISVFVDGERKCKYFNINDVEFLEEKQ